MNVMTKVSATKAHLREDLLSRLESVLPLLKSNAARTDAEGAIPQENLDALCAAGLGKILRPRRFGGIEVSLETVMELQIRMATACGSTAWVMSLASLSSYLLAHYPLKAQEEVWSTDADVRAALVASDAEAVKEDVDGGWMVSGRWRYASGSAYCQWAILAVPHTAPDGRADTGLALIPMSDIAIEKSWDVSGMRGTASDTLVIEKPVFVPRHRQGSRLAAYDGTSDLPYRDEPECIYLTPFPTVFEMAIAAPPIGMAKAALDLAAETAPKRKLPFFGIPQSESETNQVMVANAAIAADSAELHLMRAAADADAASARGEILGGKALQRATADTVAAARYSTQAVRTVIRVLMSGSFANANPMQRIWRDSEMVGSHFAFSEHMLIEYGQSLFGIEAHQ
ncbi:hypothetical protein J5277_30510 [Rhizobium sp. 16-449-1b]|uniref:acyl-CoA dehydrogenase family protein n=1 Tax=Rhizobium sp. 16-449-1b TaxID=2819989 RepID=UPI000A934919|nr:acyl-CoA dehydrogenase family protein [Rhizobium sp. 16-449-1b]MBO9198459.1 hypothetical protein [Rhizobium sp. 16-449-1b]